jgi:serine/threonine-protein kinase HipA
MWQCLLDFIESGDAKFIAKFSGTGVTNVVKGEFAAMQLASRLGLNVACAELTRAGGKDVLLVRRFDRENGKKGWRRKAMVSALTLLDLNEMMVRYASYQDLAETIRARFTSPNRSTKEIAAISEPRRSPSMRANDGGMP